MNSEEISKLFKLDQVDFEKCKSAEEYELELSNQVDDFFFKNYFKNEEILFAAFDFYYSIKLLENNDNLITLKNLLNNNKLLRYFRNKKLGIFGLIIIITAFNKSTDYDIYNIENEENYKNNKTQKIYDNYIKFTNETEDFFDFKSWFKDEIELMTANLYLSLRAMIVQNEKQRKICENLILNNLDLKNLSDFDYIFNTYIDNIKQSNINNKELVDRERDLKINKFIRNLYNMFKSLKNHILSSAIICEIVSIIYDRQKDQGKIMDLIDKGNPHFTITEYEKKYIRDQDHNIIAMEIVRYGLNNDSPT
ncbi:hypothetical protein XA39_13780 [Acinetobacter tandoii]|uniref:hypothetical protein n=1 Tax=Acinetobacter tandoii TaxID=202954 RepID=UPI000C207629|nr:hypothetical protein [Acinetobacter tandoii]PJG42200.1 hypothetical protein XA39_13780 [Acinetobacter tandoii]